MNYKNILDNLIIDTENIIVPDKHKIQIAYIEYRDEDNLTIDAKLYDFLRYLDKFIDTVYVDGYINGVELAKNRIKELKKVGIK